MAVVPDTHDFAGGVVTTSEDNTFIRDPIRFLLNKPAAKLRQTVLQSIANSTFVAITFDVEDLDSNVGGIAQHDNVTNNSRFTAAYAGWYRCDGAIGFAANATGQRVAAWFVNGAQLNDAQTVTQATSLLGVKIAARGHLIFLNVGDYVELFAFQSSGGALNSNVTAPGEQSSMSNGWERN